MSDVAVTYVGGHAEVEVYVGGLPHALQLDDPAGWKAVKRGETVSVPSHVAHGVEGRLPVFEVPVDGEAVLRPVADNEILPDGAVLVEEGVPSTSGLLAQPDNWQPARKSKAAEDKPAA